MNANEKKTAFGIGTAPVMLEIRAKAGDSWAFPYSSVEFVRYNPSAGICLQFEAHQVSISGRNLRPLYAALIEEKATHIQESDPGYDGSRDDDLFVSQIEIVPLDELPAEEPDRTIQPARDVP